MLLGTLVDLLNALVVELHVSFQMGIFKDIFDYLGVIFGLCGSHT